MFRVYTDPSLCPRFLSWTYVSEFFATSSDFLRRGRPIYSKVAHWACSKPPFHVVTTASYQNGHGLRWPYIRASDVVQTKLCQGLGHRLGHRCLDSISVNVPLGWDIGCLLWVPSLMYVMLESLHYWIEYHLDGLAQYCSNSIANALELLQSCAKPSMSYWTLS